MNLMIIEFTVLQVSICLFFSFLQILHMALQLLWIPWNTWPQAGAYIRNSPSDDITGKSIELKHPDSNTHFWLVRKYNDCQSFLSNHDLKNCHKQQL